MRSLEGASCADLPAFVIDKYFNANVGTQPFLARTARAICGHCVVLQECREEALNMPHLQKGGVIGGVAAAEIRRARAWRSYELGRLAAPPLRDRPEWLTRPDAAETIEQGLTEFEEGVER